MRSARTLLAPVVAALVLLGCKNKPADLREWRPADHSHENGEGEGAGNMPPPEQDNDPMVAAIGLWGAQCALCHGRTGRGDGPQAAMFHPPDLTAQAFQQQRTDAQIRAVIAGGRNAMPAFGNTLRPEAIDLMVRLVRQMGGGQ